MRTTHVLRKPPSESSIAANTLKHGCGGINIDRSRIRTDDNLGGGAYTGTLRQRPERTSTDTIDGAVALSRLNRGVGEFQQPEGRWPANLILWHLPECSNTTCAPNCPVVDLDEQSGDRPVSGAARTGRPAQAWGQTSTVDFGINTGNGTLHNDTGGASRFYKQVTNMDELAEYLYNLIAPTHLDDCNVIVIEDPANYDWAQHEDVSVHGAIVHAPGGQDTSYKDEVWRILKPGAHLLVYAPEDEPTGHTGACALEDQGFEVRDAILVVTEPGRLHYVPKPSRKERHAGCKNLNIVAPEGEDSDEDEDDPDAKDPTLKGNIHPTCKPRDIMKRLLLDVPKDATILDPFMGSGTTGLACLQTGHDFIGIEMSLEYIQIADARIRHWDREEGGFRDDGATIESEAPKAEKEEEKSIGLMDFFDL